jgi:hypothetical protein
MYTSPGPSGKVELRAFEGAVVFCRTVAVSNAILPPAATSQSGVGTDADCVEGERAFSACA